MKINEYFVARTETGYYNSNNLKVITDPSKIEDNALEYIYVLDMEEFACKDIIGKYYPFLCLWNGNELVRTNIPYNIAIKED